MGLKARRATQKRVNPCCRPDCACLGFRENKPLLRNIRYPLLFQHPQSGVSGANRPTGIAVWFDPRPRPITGVTVCLTLPIFLYSGTAKVPAWLLFKTLDPTVQWPGVTRMEALVCDGEYGRPDLPHCLAFEATSVEASTNFQRGFHASRHNSMYVKGTSHGNIFSPVGKYIYSHGGSSTLPW